MMKDDEHLLGVQKKLQEDFPALNSKGHILLPPKLLVTSK